MTAPSLPTYSNGSSAMVATGGFRGQSGTAQLLSINRRAAPISRRLRASTASARASGVHHEAGSRFVIRRRRGIIGTRTTTERWRRLAMTMTEFPRATPGAMGPQSFGGPDVAAKYDLSGLLPPTAAEKLRLLRVRSEEAHAVIPPFNDVQQASIAKIEAANRLKRLIDPAGVGGFSLPHDQPQVVAAERALEKAADEVSEAGTDRSEARTKAWQAASAALQSVKSWLRDGKPPNTAVEDFEAAEMKLSKGETLLEAIERHRRRARELRADVVRVQSAPYPSGHCKEKLRQEVEALAARGAPSVAGLSN